MNKPLYILTVFFLFFAHARAQETMYVPDGATISFGNNSPAGIFGYLRNNGNISIKENGQVYFLGKIWINDQQGTLTDSTTLQNSGKGGLVIFFQPNPVYGNLGQQALHSGYVDTTLSGPVFANLTIDNNAGLIITSDINTINTVNFRRGHIYLNNYTFILGDSNYTGKIAGYDQSRYFVTGALVKGGFLKYRLLPKGSLATFPIGPTDKSYSPLQMLNRGINDAFFARAFEKVYDNATSGPFVKDSSLQLTWHLGKALPAAGEALISLQHDMAVEDPIFRANRNTSYVSLYHNDTKWDKPFFVTPPQTPGNISSSFSISSAMMNSRKLMISDLPLYITKRVTKAKKSINIPNVFSPNGDNINDKWIVRGLTDYENCRVEIYNRYGQMIFQSIGYNQPWDGTFKGVPMPVATYYYLINLTPGEAPLSGSVTLLR